MSGAPAEVEREPLGQIRRATAKVMTASAAVPQFTLERAVAAAPLLELREEIKAASGSASLSDFLVAACAHSLRSHPYLNASFDDDAVVHRPQINVGNAIAIDDGLVAPCIEEADTLGLEELAAERKRLLESARAGTLTPAELLNATFTISNLGPFGVDRFRALVTPPQSAILAVGALTPGVVANDGEYALGQTINLSLSCDHRVVDGAPAAEFLAEIASRLGDPAWMLDL